MQEKNKILSITPAEKFMKSQYINKWVSIGLSIEPTDEEKGTAAIVKMYEIGGLPAPKVHWFDSPISALSAIAVDAERDSKINPETFSQVKEQVYDQILESVRSRVDDQVSYMAFNEAANSLEEVVHQRVAVSVLHYICHQIREQVSNLGEPADIFVQGDKYWKFLGGLNTAEVCVSYDFFANAMHLDIGYEKLAGLIGAAEQASFIYPFGDRVYAVRNMRKRSLDEQGRLHCENGPAVLFNDGFSVYAWRGVGLFKNKWIITNPERITAEMIENEENIFIERVMIERLTTRK